MKKNKKKRNCHPFSYEFFLQYEILQLFCGIRPINKKDLQNFFLYMYIKRLKRETFAPIAGVEKRDMKRL